MAKKSFNQIEPGQKIIVDPKTNGLFFACCDCNLVHQMQFEVDSEGNLIVQFWRHNKKTAGLRRYRGIPLETRLTKRSPDARKSALKKVSSNKKGSAKPARG